MSDRVITVNNLTKRWKKTTVVDDISFVVERGSSVGIVGESGSGKSTVVKALSGLVAPTGGDITICGEARDGSRVSKKVRLRRARQLQVVFQDPYGSLDPLQVPRDALAEILNLHRPDLSRAGRKARTTELADMVGLDSRQMGDSPRHLSGGQRQRVAIAKALATEPQVLVLDEAVSALDVSIQAQILNLLNDIRSATNTTFLFITHDLAVVRQLTESCLVMNQGRIVERGETGQVLDSPAHDYTASLVSSVPRHGWRRGGQTDVGS